MPNSLMCTCLQWCLRCLVQLTPGAWCGVPVEGFSQVLSSVWSHVQSQEANCPLKATTGIGDLLVPLGGRYNVATVGGEPGGEVGSYPQQVQAQACPEQAGPSCCFGDVAWLRLISQCSAASQGMRRLSCSNRTYTHIYHTWLSQPGRTDALPEQRGRPAERLIFNKTHSGTQREVASGKGREQGTFIVSRDRGTLTGVPWETPREAFIGNSTGPFLIPTQLLGNHSYSTAKRKEITKQRKPKKGKGKNSSKPRGRPCSAVGASEAAP